jgi:hypothetical protein
MLELADRPIVGHASGVARCFDAHVLRAAGFVQHLEYLSLPRPIVRFRDDPELSAADPHLSSHAV